MYLVSPDVSEKALDKNKEEGLNLPSGTCPSYPVLQTSATDMARQIYYERENTKSRLSLTISRVQKEMNDVLNNKDMEVEEKLHIYN